MESPNNFFPNNLKFLRNHRNMSQEDMGKVLGIKREKYSSWENNIVKSFSPEDLARLADFFRVSIDVLIRMDLSKMTAFKLREYIGSDAYISGANLRILAKTVDSDNRENVELVTKKGQAGYFDGFNDPEYIGTLPVFNLPFLSENGSYRMFHITGRSMSPDFPDELYVLGAVVENWLDLSDGDLVVVVLKKVQQILFKSVYLDRKNGVFVLRSRNSEFEDIELYGEDIKEIWKLHGYYTSRIPEETGTMATINQELKELRREFNEFAGVFNKKGL